MSKVLVVQAEADIRRLLEIRLSRLGHQVISTGSAAEAMTAVAEHGAPDVAVLDIVMRDVSGLELLDRMRQEPEYARMPAIFLTARELDGDAEAAHALGAGYLKKPIVMSALSGAIERALAPRDAPAREDEH